MADTVVLPGTGQRVSTEEVITLNGSVVTAEHVQRVAVTILTAGATAVDLPGDAANGADVDVTRLPALVAGTAVVGKVGIDQTTPGTTNGVQIVAALPAGDNVIGAVLQSGPWAVSLTMDGEVVTGTNPLAVTLATYLSADSLALGEPGDSVQVGQITGKFYDGEGTSLTVKSAHGAASSSGVNDVVAAVTSKKIRVLSYSLQAADGNASVITANWQDDSGSPVVLSQTWDFEKREGVSKSLGGGPGFYFETTSGQALKLNLSAGSLPVRWELVYVEA